MLGQQDALPTLPVKNLDAARRFYTDTVGLRPVDDAAPGTLSFHAGSSTVLVYESQFAGTNHATAVTWPMDDVDAAVKTLRDKGVTFEHYDGMPNTRLEGDVHVSDHMRVAWFKDPDGNIHALVSDSRR